MTIEQSWARQPSLGREFHNWGAVMEKALSIIPTSLACDIGGIQRRPSPIVLNTYAEMCRISNNLDLDHIGLSK